KATKRLSTPAMRTTAEAATGTAIAVAVPSTSARTPLIAEDTDWPTMMAEPAIDITVAQRPLGDRSAARLNRVTRLGPMAEPISSTATVIIGMDSVEARSSHPTTMICEKHSTRAHRVNDEGRAATEIAITADPMPMTP